MSSSIDQRSNKSHESHESNNPTREIDYGYAHDPQGYSQMSHIGPVTDQHQQQQYMNYYSWNLPSYQANPEGVWSGGRGGDPNLYSNYGQMANPSDYMQPGGGHMYNQYDYSYWYNMDPSGASSWGGPSNNQVYKGRDYHNGSYYGGPIPVNQSDNLFNGEIINGPGISGVSSLHGMEQNFKHMNLSSGEVDEKDDITTLSNSSAININANRSTGTGTPVGKKSWANVVTQPIRSNLNRAKTIPRAPITMLTKQNSESGSGWEGSKITGSGNIKIGNGGIQQGSKSMGEGRHVAPGPYGSQGGLYNNTSGNIKPNTFASQYHQQSNQNHQQFNSGVESAGDANSKSLPSGSGGQILVNQNDYNPKEFDLNPKGARFFVIKSFSEDDIHRSIKYSIWCSTEYGNKRLDAAYKEQEGKGQVFLYYSVNGSGHFCGVALMTSFVDYHSSANVWAQNKWKGQFSVKWIYVKDVPNSQLRHIKLENNENKPVTNSRDTQEVPAEKGRQVLRIVHQYRHTTSIFDDFSHYEKQQEEAVSKKDN